MLLQPTISKPPYRLHSHQNHVVPVSTHSYTISSPSGFIQNPAYRFTSKTHRNALFITCAWGFIGKSRGSQKTPESNWSDIFSRISTMKDPKMGSSSVLNQMENEGKTLTKKDLRRVILALKMSGKYRYALQVYKWMKEKQYKMKPKDAADQLDLIVEVHGVEKAEKYLKKLPFSLKSIRIFYHLLKAYVSAGLKEKAETLFIRLRSRDFADTCLPYNLLMRLYLNLEHYKEVELLISDMMVRKIPLDISSYNHWLSAILLQGSLEKLKQAIEQLKHDAFVKPNYNTFRTLAATCLALGQSERAVSFLNEYERTVPSRLKLDSSTLLNLAVIYYKLGHLERAEFYMKKYARAVPSKPKPNFTSLGEMALKYLNLELGQLETAVFEEYFQSFKG